MKYLITILTLLFFCQCTTDVPAPKPNIVYILADDLGYNEVGCFGQDIIKTPNIDQLASEGISFSQHYSGSPVCAPSRCVLMTGFHTGHAYIRGNDEWRERGEVWNFAKAVQDPGLEGQRPIPDETVTVAELLQGAGYKTACIGKWGLGAPGTEGVPNRQGFDLFFGYNCQRQAHTFFPKHLWKNEEKVWLDNKLVVPATKLKEGADPNDPASYTDYSLTDYSPEFMLNEALTFLEENKDSPFFLYYPSPIPHVPIQAPSDWVDKYREILGPEEPYLGESGYFPNLTPRATYAAMVSYLDFQVGEIIAKLKEMGVYENTLIMFSSDNGPTYAGGADSEFFESANPFQSIGGRVKGTVFEGGIRVPMIASWQGRINPGTKTDHISAFYDVLPTICDVVGIPEPTNTDGISFLPTLVDGNEQEQHEFMYWEFPAYGGQQAVRMGKWKAIRKNMFKGNMEVELYDLETDIREEHNVATDHPDVVKKVEEILVEQHVPASIDRFKFKMLGD